MKAFTVSNPYTDNEPFPNTKPRIADAGQTNGTAFNYDFVAEQWGFFQASLVRAGMTPSGDIESSTASQILESLIKNTDGVVLSPIMQFFAYNYNTPGKKEFNDAPKVACIAKPNSLTLKIESATTFTADNGFYREIILIPEAGFATFIDPYDIDNWTGVATLTESNRGPVQYRVAYKDLGAAYPGVFTGYGFWLYPIDLAQANIANGAQVYGHEGTNFTLYKKFVP